MRVIEGREFKVIRRISEEEEAIRFVGDSNCWQRLPGLRVVDHELAGGRSKT